MQSVRIPVRLIRRSLSRDHCTRYLYGVGTLSPPPPPKPKFGKGDSAFIQFPVAYREKGQGRPTKKERREIDKFRDE